MKYSETSERFGCCHRHQTHERTFPPDSNTNDLSVYAMMFGFPLSNAHAFFTFAFCVCLLRPQFNSELLCFVCVSLRLFLFLLESCFLLLLFWGNSHKHQPKNKSGKLSILLQNFVRFESKKIGKSDIRVFEENFTIQVMSQNIIKSNQKLVFSRCPESKELLPYERHREFWRAREKNNIKCQ